MWTYKIPKTIEKKHKEDCDCMRCYENIYNIDWNIWFKKD